jgi:hypothetical protein
MIVMNMDSNIKNNVEPVTLPTIETQLAYWQIGVDLVSGSFGSPLQFACFNHRREFLRHDDVDVAP